MATNKGAVESSRLSRLRVGGASTRIFRYWSVLPICLLGGNKIWAGSTNLQNTGTKHSYRCDLLFFLFQVLVPKYQYFQQVEDLYNSMNPS